MANNNGKQVTGWVGWIYFAGFMMLILGILQMIAGLTALLNDQYYLVGRESLLVFDFTTWGWIHLLVGFVVTLAGTAVINGHFWGRLLAIFLAIISIVANFVFLPAYPLWSLTVIVIDIFVIYALTVHGSETEV